MSGEKMNGNASKCELQDECREHHLDMQRAISDIDTINYNMKFLVKHTHYLAKLETIDSSLKILQEAMVSIRNGLLPAATGSDRIPTLIVEKQLESKDKSATLVYKILGVVIVVLLAIIYYLITNEHIKLPGLTP